MFNLNYKISADYFQLLSMFKDKKIFKYIDKNLSNISLGGYSSNFFLSSKEFYEILDYLEDMNIISIQHDQNNKKSKKVFLRKHLITEAHSEA
jgi:hypothetical protein